MKHRVVIIGVGNELRHDDAVGPVVVQRLRDHPDAMPAGDDGDVVLATSDGEAAALLDLWDGADLAVVVDAVCAQPPHPGRVHRLTVHRPPGERARAASSHGMDLGDAVELGRALDRLPHRLVLYAIEAADVTTGLGLSPAVAASAGRVADEITAEIAAEIGAPSCA
jgi:hydrogenase maturation protease